MKIQRSLLAIVFLMFIGSLTSSCNKDKVVYESDWHAQPDRIWVGPDMWANRLQDWKIEEGKLQCINSNLGFRTVHLLTHQIGNISGEVFIEVSMGLNPEANRNETDGWAGILIGAGEDQLEYRASALIHNASGKTAGIVVAMNEFGQVVFLDNTNGRENIGNMPGMPEVELPDSVRLTINIHPGEDSLYTISASAIDPESKDIISSNTLTKLDPKRLMGNIAITANHIEKDLANYSYSFSNLLVSGTKVSSNSEHRFGPILGVQYTLSRNILKMTAQLPPIGDEDDQFVKLWIKGQQEKVWQLADSAIIIKGSYTVPFRIDHWESNRNFDYRLTYRLNDLKGRKRTYFYTGSISADPIHKKELIVGAFTGMSHSHGSITKGDFDYTSRLWFPHSEFIKSVAGQKPDILFFTGDQVYEGRPTPPDFSTPENTELDYLYKWYLYLWTVGDLSRNIPTIALPDDHDVFHGNIWGAGGKAAPRTPTDTIYPPQYEGREGHWQQDQGGYKLRASTVNMVQTTQTSHLPDAYDPTPVEQGIGVYYTDLNYGRVSFAILEDRKFKSAPSIMLPEARVVNGFAQNRYISGRRLDNPEAKLLGDRQLKFIDEWTENWLDVDMKVSISQTIFGNLSTYPIEFSTDAGTPGLSAPKPGEIPTGYKVAKDMDSNGWPQTGRNKALRALRKGFTTMIGGDQHLGSLTQMGVDTWNDAGYTFCVPSIGNLWPRRWFPPQAGIDHVEGMPDYTGKYFDGFGNRIHVWAVANPVETQKEPLALYDRAVGYGIIRLDRSAGDITFECWRREADPNDPETGIYPGWPKSINNMDNYSRSVRSWLPNYEVSGLSHYPVYQIIDEATKEILYTVRVNDFMYQPGVFDYSGEYTIRIGDPDTDTFQIFENVKSSYRKKEDVVKVEF